MADDGFHEIQLNGKQLVFLFMATTVVAVVIFLGGVLVGRGVRLEQGTQAASAPPGALTAEQAVPPGGPGEATAARSEAGDLGYYGRLGKDTPPPETLSPPGDVAPGTPLPAGEPAKAPEATTPPAPQPDQPLPEKPLPEKPATKPASEQAAPAGAASERLASVKNPKPTAGASAPAAEPKAGVAPPPAGSIVVQVAALEEQGEAEAMLSKLLARNYAAFILPPSGDKYYRVRVGAFKTRREAEGVVRRLQSEGFKPWITR